MGHFLSALELQQSSSSIVSMSGLRSVMSDNLWSAVDTTLLLMKRSDLRTAVSERDLTTLSNDFVKDDEGSHSWWRGCNLFICFYSLFNWQVTDAISAKHNNMLKAYYCASPGTISAFLHYIHTTRQSCGFECWYLCFCCHLPILWSSELSEYGLSEPPIFRRYVVRLAKKCFRFPFNY